MASNWVAAIRANAWAQRTPAPLENSCRAAVTQNGSTVSLMDAFRNASDGSRSEFFQIGSNPLVVIRRRLTQITQLKPVKRTQSD